MIMGYTIGLNVIIESGHNFESRLFFIENHLVYLIGYGAPITLAYYTLPLVLYFATQSILVPLMIVNSREYFRPKIMPHTFPIITFLNKLNVIIFENAVTIIKQWLPKNV